MVCESCKKSIGSNARECDECLSYLNRLRLSFTITEQLGITENQASAITGINHFIKDFELNQIFLFQKRLEAATAEVMVIYHTKKVKEKIPDPKSAEKKGEEYAAAVKIQKFDQMSKKEKKVMSEKDKAIQALMNSGVTEAMATTIIESEFKKLGKFVG